MNLKSILKNTAIFASGMAAETIRKNVSEKNNKLLSPGQAVAALELAKDAKDVESVISIYATFLEPSEKDFIRDALSVRGAFQEFKNYLIRNYEDIDEDFQKKALNEIDNLESKYPKLHLEIGTLHSIPACVTPNNRRKNRFYKAVAEMPEKEIILHLTKIHNKYPLYPELSEYENQERYKAFCIVFDFDTDENETRAKAVCNFLVMKLSGSLESKFASFLESALK